MGNLDSGNFFQEASPGRKGERKEGREGDQLAMAREGCTIVLGVFLGFGETQPCLKGQEGNRTEVYRHFRHRKP